MKRRTRGAGWCHWLMTLPVLIHAFHDGEPISDSARLYLQSELNVRDVVFSRHLLIRLHGEALLDARSRTQCCVCPSRIIVRFQLFCEGKSNSSRCEERARPVTCTVFDICCQGGPISTPLHPCMCSTTLKFETFWLCTLTYSVPRRSILLTTSTLTSASLGPRSTRCLSSTPYPHNCLTLLSTLSSAIGAMYSSPLAALIPASHYSF
jgi:hypothetical protein